MNLMQIRIKCSIILQYSRKGLQIKWVQNNQNKLKRSKRKQLQRIILTRQQLFTIFQLINIQGKLELSNRIFQNSWLSIILLKLKFCFLDLHLSKIKLKNLVLFNHITFFVINHKTWEKFSFLCQKTSLEKTL